MGPLAPHDLLWLRDPADLITVGAVPDWTAAALARVPMVVVRRALPLHGLIPVGVRGTTRALRAAAWLAPRSIARRITPESLARQRGWLGNPRLGGIPALRALHTLAPGLDALGMAWGPGGSVGFELASGHNTTTEASDLDLVIRAPRRLQSAALERISALLATAAVRVDVQVETPIGAFALAECLQRASRTLVRTLTGPRLVADPWDDSSAPRQEAVP